MRVNQSKLPTGLKNVDVERVLRSNGIYLRLKTNQALKEAAKTFIQESRKKTKTTVSKTIEERRSANFTNAEIDGYWQKQIHVVEVVEQHFENKLAQFIDKVGADFMKHFDEEVKTRKSFIKFINKDYFSDNEDDLLQQAGVDFEPLLNSVAVMAGNNANKLIGLDSPYLPFNYRDKIGQNVSKFTKSLLDTDRQHLITIITNGLADGKTVADIRNQIESDFSDYSKMQAQRISRTEVIRTSNQAAIDAFEQSGVVEGKQWVTFGATDECENYDGQIVTLSDSFYGGDNEFQDGDPPLHPNCRCVVIPIVEGGEKTYRPDNTKLVERVKELEGRFDKRTKEYKELVRRSVEEKADDKAYIRMLEKYLGVDDEQA